MCICVHADPLAPQPWVHTVLVRAKLSWSRKAEVIAPAAESDWPMLEKSSGGEAGCCLTAHMLHIHTRVTCSAGQRWFRNARRFARTHTHALAWTGSPSCTGRQ